jgi:Flp pilus assembly protein TadD
MPLAWQIAFGGVARRRALAALAASLLLAACADPSSAPVTASLAAADRGPVAETGARPPIDIAPLAAAHKANPADAEAALAYARGLRASGAKREALAVLDKAAAGKTADRRLQLERGLLALELGQTAKAEKLLRQAHDANAPDWRLHSALGAALATGGRQPEAQAQFAKALALAPDHPTVLNNLALSYALDGKAAEAEKLLRTAKPGPAQTPQVKQNLALVVGLRGRYEEARGLGEAALPPAKAGDNVAYLQRLASAKANAGSAALQPERSADPPAKVAPAKANASLPQPTYQLGRLPPEND